VFCIITKDGLQLLEKIGSRISKIEHSALDVLSQRELKEFMELLHKVYRVVG
jgi:hypothetical protein